MFKNKNTTQIEKKRAYNACWDAIFTEIEEEIVLVNKPKWDDTETCECGKNIKYCRYPNCTSA